MLLGHSAAAQEMRGRITGIVSDNTGAVLPGVAVTVAGPALIQPQTTTTNAEGSYRYPALPPGVYALTFELSGFQTVRREDIRLPLNTTITADVALQIATLAETVTITGQSPVVDIKTTTIGTNFTKELLQDIPNARDLWAAMAQAPGFQMTSYDVGGSRTGTQTGYQTYGVSGQNKTLLEGINVTEGTDSNAGYFDFGSFEEMQLGGSGNMGEQSGLGAFINIREVRRRQARLAGLLRPRKRSDDFQQRAERISDARRRRCAWLQGALDPGSADRRVARSRPRKPHHASVRLRLRPRRSD
jgi:hypothetical protein